MGKSYIADLDEIAIIDGKLTGCVINDNFSSRNDTTKEDRKLNGATFDLDGLPVETMIRFLWDALKVKAQARSWKKMDDKTFLALDGENHNINDFIKASERVGSKVAIVNNLKIETQKKFFDKALEKAVAELGADATTEEHVGWATKYYDEEYKEIVESMA